MAESVLVDCGLVGEEDVAAADEAHVWLLHVRASHARAAYLERLCVEAGGGRLHSLSLTAMRICEEEGNAEGGGEGEGDTGGDKASAGANGVGSGGGRGKGVLPLKPCPQRAREQMRRWMRAAGVSGETAGLGGVSALLVCALEKLAKGRAGEGGRVGGEEQYMREVIASLFHRSAHAMAVLRALFRVGGMEGGGWAADPEALVAPLGAYCSKLVGCDDGVGDKGKAALVAQELWLADGLLGEGGGEELSDMAWHLWGRYSVYLLY